MKRSNAMKYKTWLKDQIKTMKINSREYDHNLKLYKKINRYSESLEYMNSKEKHICYKTFLNNGNEDTFKGFVKYCKNIIFNKKTGNVIYFPLYKLF